MKLIIILKSKIRGLVVESLCDVLEALCSSPIIRELIDELNASDKNWRCNPVVEYRPSMHRALGPVPSITKSECGGTHPSIILVLRRQRQEGGSEVQGQPWQFTEFKACLKCKRRKTTMATKKKNHALKPQAHLQERGLYTSAVYSGLQTLDSTR